MDNDIPKGIRIGFFDHLTFGRYKGRSPSELYFNWLSVTDTYRPSNRPMDGDPLYVEMLVDTGCLIMSKLDIDNIRNKANLYAEETLLMLITDPEEYMEP